MPVLEHISGLIAVNGLPCVGETLATGGHQSHKTSAIVFLAAAPVQKFFWIFCMAAKQFPHRKFPFGLWGELENPCFVTRNVFQRSWLPHGDGSNSLVMQPLCSFCHPQSAFLETQWEDTFSKLWSLSTMHMKSVMTSCIVLLGMPLISVSCTLWSFHIKPSTVT